MPKWLVQGKFSQMVWFMLLLFVSLSLTLSLPCLLYGYTGWSGWDRTEQNGAGPTRSLSLSNTFPALFALWLHTGWPGQDGTEQEGTGPTLEAEATRSTQAATTMWEGPVRVLLFLSFFLYFHLFFISLSFLSNNRRRTKGKHRMDGTGHTRRGRR